MKLSAEQIRTVIREKMPEGSVIADHDKKGHFYKIMTPDEKSVVGNRYPSVTGKLQILKDESLINYKMNKAIEYVFQNWNRFTDANVMEHLDLAARVSQDNLADAGDVGTEIHDTRERIFKDWIATGVRPADFLSYIAPEMLDVRVRSALRALDLFCTDHSYVPIACELFVYSHKLKVAGTLDDLGMMRKMVREGDPTCKHEIVDNRCVKCDYKQKIIFVLMDVKTSNAFKDHYFFQVSLYYEMFKKLTGLRPDECFILKLSKIDGTYKVENLKRPSTLASYARAMVKTKNGIEYIKQLRRDNQKVVGEHLVL